MTFCRRVYPLRVLGLSLLALPYASAMLDVHAPQWLWLPFAFTAFVWPHLAYLRAVRSHRPAQAEFGNLVIDAALGGFWIAASYVSAPPAVVLICILAADRVAAGGWRLFFRAALAMMVTFLLTWWAMGFPFDPYGSLQTRGLSVVPLLIYMLALSHVSYKLAKRISHQNDQLDRLNRTDPALDLPNRRFFNMRASEMIAAARLDSLPVTMLWIDVDHFKSINDLYGHGAGDEVLREIARILRETVGADGFPARVGGDEFAVLCSAPLSRGWRIACRIRDAVAALSFADWPALRVSISVGIAELEPAHQGLDEWMGAADRAMYVAKAEGRNQVAGWRDGEMLREPARESSTP